MKKEKAEAISKEFFEAFEKDNDGVDIEAASEKGNEMFKFLAEWSKPGDFMILASGAGESVKGMMRAAAEELTINDYAEFVSNVVSTVLQLYALCEQRLIVDTNKKLEAAENASGSTEG